MITSKSILMSKYIAEPINQTTDCRMFRPRRPLSAAYKTHIVFAHQDRLAMYMHIIAIVVHEDLYLYAYIYAKMHNACTLYIVCVESLNILL